MPIYETAIDESRNFLELKSSGFVRDDAQIVMEHELGAAFARLAAAGHARGTHLVLVDARAQGVLSREVAARLQSDIAQHGKASRRVAIVGSGSALHKMQAKRIAAADTGAVFVSRDEALHWLFADQGAPDPPS